MSIFRTESWKDAYNIIQNETRAERRQALSLAVSAALLAEPLHDFIENQAKTIKMLEEMKNDLGN
jgi:hypothetical protein